MNARFLSAQCFDGGQIFYRFIHFAFISRLAGFLSTCLLSEFSLCLVSCGEHCVGFTSDVRLFATGYWAPRRFEGSLREVTRESGPRVTPVATRREISSLAEASQRLRLIRQDRLPKGKPVSPFLRHANTPLCACYRRGRRFRFLGSCRNVSSAKRERWIGSGRDT